MQRFGLIAFCTLALWVFTSCEGSTFMSSVPAYPVRIAIDTRTVFVDFLPENLNAYVTVDRDGYYENGKYMLPITVVDAWGYGGVVAYVSLAGYVAFDLACPYCAGRGKKSPCFMDGIHAECPECSEQYEIASGYALPQKGISKEALRPLRIKNNGGKLEISQRQ